MSHGERTKSVVEVISAKIQGGSTWAVYVLYISCDIAFQVGSDGP